MGADNPKRYSLPFEIAPRHVKLNNFVDAPLKPSDYQDDNPFQ